MTDKQIVEFPTVAPQDTDLLVKQSSGGTYQKCTFKQASDEILGRIPAEIPTISRPNQTAANLQQTDTIEFQRTSNETYYSTNFQNLYLWMANKLYPIGSYYHNHSNSANPSTLLGFGTWVAVRGRVLVGEGSGTDVNGSTVNFAAGSTGGEYSHTLDITEMPVHDHYMFSGGSFGVTSIAAFPNRRVAYNINNSQNEAWLPGESINPADEGKTGPAGGSGSSTLGHNNIQPYQTVYLWRRTA